MPQTTSPLRGARILIVEDRYLIAAEAADTVRRLGGEVVGPAPTLAAAHDALRTGRVDAAVLDVDLDTVEVFPLAAELDAAGIPFVFLTGYDVEHFPLRWRTHQILAKPANFRALRKELQRLCRSDGPIAI